MGSVHSCGRHVNYAKLTVMSLHASILLTTERLLLVLPRASAARRLVEYYERNASHLAPSSPERSPDYNTEAAWLERASAMESASRKGEALHGLLVSRDDPDGPLVGTVNITGVMRGAFQAAYLGYGLDEGAEGKGIMSEALQAVVSYAFDNMGLHRLMANYMPTNERSGRVLRRLGFRIEGYAHDYLKLNGAWRDHILTAKVAEK